MLGSSCLCKLKINANVRRRSAIKIPNLWWSTSAPGSLVRQVSSLRWLNLNALTSLNRIINSKSLVERLSLEVLLYAAVPRALNAWKTKVGTGFAHICDVWILFLCVDYKPTRVQVVYIRTWRLSSWEKLQEGNSALNTSRLVPMAITRETCETICWTFSPRHWGAFVYATVTTTMIIVINTDIN